MPSCRTCYRFNNPTGAAATFSTAGKIDLTGPVLSEPGNQRTRLRHLSPAERRLDGHAAKHPGAVRCHGRNGSDLPHQRWLDVPNADVSTVEARRSAYSMLLDKGLIRVGIGIPANAEFDLIAVDDPYGYASAARTVAVPSPVAFDQSQIPEHRHVGRTRNVHRSGFERLHSRHDQVLRHDPLRSRRPVEQRDDRACPGSAAAHHRAARGDRRLRDHAVHRAGVRRRGGRADGAPARSVARST